jgi:APA family basic amino acid/polyamine antiporter
MSMIVSLFYVSLAYTGFNASIYLAGEVEKETDINHRRNFVSRSMWMACVLVMLLYLLLNFVFLYGLSPERIAQSGEGYVAVVAENIGGSVLSRLIRFAIILSAATSILAMMATGPMVYAQMAADGRLPRFFQITNQVPRIAIFVQASLSCIVVWISDIEGIIKFLGLTLTACGALAVSSIWFAKKNFMMEKPIRWYEHVATILYISGAVLFLVVASQREQNQFWLCIGAFATGALVYAAAAIRRRRTA